MRLQWARETPEEGNGCYAKLPDTIALRRLPPPSHGTALILSGARRYSRSNEGVGARNGGVCAQKFPRIQFWRCLTERHSPQPPSLALPRPHMHAPQSGLHSTTKMGRWDGGSAEQHPQNHPKPRCNMGEWLPSPAHSKPRPTKHTIWCDCECGFWNCAGAGEWWRERGATPFQVHPGAPQVPITCVSFLWYRS